MLYTKENMQAKHQFLKIIYKSILDTSTSSFNSILRAFAILSKVSIVGLLLPSSIVLIEFLFKSESSAQ